MKDARRGYHEVVVPRPPADERDGATASVPHPDPRADSSGIHERRMRGEVVVRRPVAREQVDTPRPAPRPRRPFPSDGDGDGCPDAEVRDRRAR